MVEINNKAYVEFHFFQKSGKWYASEWLEWKGIWRGSAELITVSIAKTLRHNLLIRGEQTYRYTEFNFVCIEPYHEHSHPIMGDVLKAIEEW